MIKKYFEQPDTELKAWQKPTRVWPLECEKKYGSKFEILTLMKKSDMNNQHY
jgi:hypothetical protein